MKIWLYKYSGANHLSVSMLGFLFALYNSMISSTTSDNNLVPLSTSVTNLSGYKIGEIFPLSRRMMPVMTVLFLLTSWTSALNPIALIDSTIVLSIVVFICFYLSRLILCSLRNCPYITLDIK